MRLPPLEMCEVRDLDPLDGINGVICASLLSRSRPPGRSIEEQWSELWRLIFPDDPKPYGEVHPFTPKHL
jgi:hypothetical protein